MKNRRITIAIISVIVIATFLFGSIAVASNPVIISASTTNVKVDGEVMTSLQYIEYQIYIQEENPIYIGGLASVGYYVNCTLRVQSTYLKFDEMLINPTPNTFQLVFEMVKQARATSN